ncbi:MAG: hypothetical protein K0S33_1012 [Bacteroidetes bacterium]|jgi:predicted ATPase|nr:hypothetical protein [Bacteroidota bacterium]
MSNKIEQAQEILKSFKLPTAQQNQAAALTLLALCNIKPADDWQDAERRSMVLSTEIMPFMKDHYNVVYKSGTRESLRKEAINPFVEFGIIDKNPDNPDLPKNSPNTHYAISLLALNTIKKYNTDEWDLASENYSKYLNEMPKGKGPMALVKKIAINSYKSIFDDKIELGRFNVFIGANGCGKTNILEALATVGAEVENDLSLDGLYSRGVRTARPDLILSSFSGTKQNSTIDISLVFENTNKEVEEYDFLLSPVESNDIYSRWVNLADSQMSVEKLLRMVFKLFEDNSKKSTTELHDELLKLKDKGIKPEGLYDHLLSEYAIFDLNTKALRGISSESKKTPLGINGEGLDLLIANLSKSERARLNDCLKVFEWLEEVIADKDDKYKLTGLKPGRSTSNLYFKDKYMLKDNNTFSAENSNEGILHVLFYLALFISDKTPNLLAIDNIETALNPRLCQVLTTELVKIAKEKEKQVLITTHNPAVLDGLNLLDDEQRLFEVYRNSEGQTKTRRIKFKSDLSDKKFKLSEMWLKGQLGAVPNNF